MHAAHHYALRRFIRYNESRTRYRPYGDSTIFPHRITETPTLCERNGERVLSIPFKLSILYSGVHTHGHQINGSKNIAVYINMIQHKLRLLVILS